MKIYSIIAAIITLFLLSSCVEEIPIKSNFEPQLFISGNLRDATEPIIIDIQETVPVEELELNPISDAKISLYTKDTGGNVALVSDVFTIEEGSYTTSQEITTTIGSSYWIEIVLQDGTTYLSDIELLKPPVEVNDIAKVNGSTRVTFNDPIEDTNFYLFHFIFYEDDKFVDESWELSNDVLFNGNDDAYYETESSEGDSIYVSIQNLNFNTYQFYLNSLSQYYTQIETEESTDEQTSTIDPTQLFLPPPASLIGNITNITKNKRALGFFCVASFDSDVKKF